MVRKFIIDIIKNRLPCCYGFLRAIKDKVDIRKWERNNRPVPPPYAIKRMIIKKYAKEFFCQIFIETGTFFGDTVEAVRRSFQKIFSIELSRPFYENASKRFFKFKHISIIYGNSTDVLPDILKSVEKPVLFWLDGHYSGGITAKGKTQTPIKKELECILNHYISNHVILIDDARLYNGVNDWPAIEELQKMVFEKRPDLSWEVKNDIIRIYKKREFSEEFCANGID